MQVGGWWIRCFHSLRGNTAEWSWPSRTRRCQLRTHLSGQSILWTWRRRKCTQRVRWNVLGARALLACSAAKPRHVEGGREELQVPVGGEADPSEEGALEEPHEGGCEQRLEDGPGGEIADHLWFTACNPQGFSFRQVDLGHRVCLSTHYISWCRLWRS